MRRFLAFPAALAMSLLIAGTALAAFCGVDNKPDGAGQRAILLVDFRTDPPTEVIVAGANAKGKMTGGFADVYLDFDFNGVPSDGDCVIHDTFIISAHSGKVAPGQLLDGLGVLPPIHRGSDPGGPTKGAGSANISGNCGF